MALQLFSNNATTTLAAPITSGSLTLSVTAGAGTLFPVATLPQWFTATLMHIVSNVVTALEIIKCSANGTDSFAIQRAQEGTTALSWSAGDTLALFPTAGGLTRFVQIDDLQSQSGNYAVDTGIANVYVAALTPTLPGHIVGMPIRWKAAHPNTGPCSFNDGAGPAPLVITPGVPVPAGTIVTGGIYTSVWDGTAFQLGFAANFAPFATITYVNTYANGSSGPGWTVLPNGKTFMWGTFAGQPVSPATIIFPKSGGFPTACESISVTPINSQSTYDTSNPAASATQFTLNFGASNTPFSWSAFGH